MTYWWAEDIYATYRASPMLGDLYPTATAQSTGDNVRYRRQAWEVLSSSIGVDGRSRWHPYVGGADGAAWIEPQRTVLNWGLSGIEIKLVKSVQQGREAYKLASEDQFHRVGVTFPKIGHIFNARVFLTPSIFGDAAPTILPSNPASIVCLLNSSSAKAILSSLNPSVNFGLDDVERLPVRELPQSEDIFSTLESAFTQHESHREPSVEFLVPGPSPWRAAQAWAQTAVDRPEGAPLPDYNPELDPEPPTDHLSYALGVALGRFAASGGFGRAQEPPSPSPLPSPSPSPSPSSPSPSPRIDLPAPDLGNRAESDDGDGDGNDHGNGNGNVDGNVDGHGNGNVDGHGNGNGPGPSRGQGILDPATDDLSHALPHGLLYLDGTLEPGDLRDDLGHPAAAPLFAAWATQHIHLDTKRAGLREWLRLDFFGLHRAMYENRPIHWPLSSADRTFVLWVNIHRMGPRTLTEALARLTDTATRLDGEAADLRAARDGADRKAARDAEKRLGRVVRWREELALFMASLERCAEQGPPPSDPRCPPRAADARYAPDLDDGVMVNSAALWPLLDPQWKDPKKWWGELARAEGRKDYDWSRLAARYWPARVAGKCVSDPSLAVAHGCFWRLHPARAWAWELRLQDEIGPSFRIEEVDHALHREVYLRDHPDDALAAVEKEGLRRLRRASAPIPTITLLEPGLWSTLPQRCWSLELSLSERQGAELRLLAPDEPAARAAHELAHPDAAAERRRTLANLKPRELFGEGGEMDEGGGDEVDEEES